VDATNSSANYVGITQAVRDTYILSTKDYFLHTATVRYRTDRYTFMVGVRNLFDQDPLQISSGFYNRIANAPLYSGYDIIGRTFFVNVAVHF
jgi:outer membrane receptor protein involved in Fe transport